MNKYLDIAPEVAAALAENRPVVALESATICQDLPFPQNLETARAVVKIIRDAGVIPATVAILGGRLKVGLTPEEIEYLCRNGHQIAKASRRDFPVLVAQKADGAATAAATMVIASLAGVKVFSTAGIGGVHRGAQTTMDISSDLEELSHTSVAVICGGIKPILDLGMTLEYLETKGVVVLGYQTRELPAFYTPHSGFEVDYQVDTPEELAAIIDVKRKMEQRGGLLITNPISQQYAMNPYVINVAVDTAVDECRKKGIHGKATTPFILERVQELTGGESIELNMALEQSNARLAAAVANALCKLS